MLSAHPLLRHREGVALRPTTIDEDLVHPSARELQNATSAGAYPETVSASQPKNGRHQPCRPVLPEKPTDVDQLLALPACLEDFELTHRIRLD